MFREPASREEAYRQLLLIAEYLARTEPHSPVPYLIRRGVEWGNKPLSELLGELISADAESRRFVDVARRALVHALVVAFGRQRDGRQHRLPGEKRHEIFPHQLDRALSRFR